MLTAIVQPIGVVLCFWLIFRFRILHSVIIVMIVYGANVLLEIGINFTLVMFDLKQLIAIMQGDTFVGRMILISAMILACLLIARFRIGFSFIQVGHTTTNSGNIQNKKMLLLSVFGLVFIASCSYSWFHWHGAVIIVNSSIFFVLIILLQWAYRRELTE
jgi:hypothetical protein